MPHTSSPSRSLPFFCQRSIPLTFTSFLSVFNILPTLHLLGRESPASSFCACSQCHCSISLAPSTLWLTMPAATDPVFLLAFLLQPTLATFPLWFFLGKKIPKFLERIVLFPSFSKAFHDTPFSAQTHAPVTLSMVRHLLPSDDL